MRTSSLTQNSFTEPMILQPWTAKEMMLELNIAQRFLRTPRNRTGSPVLLLKQYRRSILILEAQRSSPLSSRRKNGIPLKIIIKNISLRTRMDTIVLLMYYIGKTACRER